MKKTVLVPPDGGYGWVIVFAYALNQFFLVPLMINTGLIFKNKFIQMELSATQQSFIVTLHSAFGMLTGLVNGALLKRYGYRKMSFIGSALNVTGMAVSSYCTTFEGVLISYGMISSWGRGFTTSSYLLAINTYFKEKKSRAIGLAMSITALGPIIIPQIINLLIQHYDPNGVVLILAAINSHSLISAVLLQPVKYHMIQKVIEVEDLEKIIEETEEEVHEDEAKDEMPEPTTKILIQNRSFIDIKANRFRRKDSSISISYDMETAGIVGLDSNLGGSMYSLESVSISRPRKISCGNLLQPTRTQWWKSENSINLESSYDLFQEKKAERARQMSLVEADKEPISNEDEPKVALFKKILQRVAEIFDLNLLKDPIYVNILFGISLLVFAEVNFSTLTPFILDDFDMTTAEIATFLSWAGTSDIIFRFIAPYAGELLKQPPRIMLLITLFGIIASRFALFWGTGKIYMILVAMCQGAGKGLRLIHMSLVIPTYVPLDKLAAASGMQLMLNGLCIIIGGPILGFLRDYTGSYMICVFMINMFSFTTIVIWTIEMVYTRMKKKQSNNCGNV